MGWVTNWITSVNESGVLVDTALSYAASVFASCYGLISESLPTVYVLYWPKFLQAMHPALILIIVNKERSIVDTFGFSTVHCK